MSKKTAADRRREETREDLWPDSAKRIWRGPEEKGYWCAPRVLPLLLHLTQSKALVGAKDCSFVYLELLARDFGQGVVEILDEDEHAFFAGYTSGRAKRTWQERVRALRDAGFIEVKPKGNRQIGFILILHPAQVVAKLKAGGKVPDNLWQLYQKRLRDIGAPVHTKVAPELRVIDGGAQSKPRKKTKTR
jgi:hypothetical protein